MPAGNDERKILESDESKKIYNSFITSSESYDNIGVDELRAIMKVVQEATGSSGKNLWMPVRIAITGRSHGPELPRLIEYFGKDEVISRMKKAIGID